VNFRKEDGRTRRCKRGEKLEGPQGSWGTKGGGRKAENKNSNSKPIPLQLGSKEKSVWKKKEPTSEIKENGAYSD